MAVEERPESTRPVGTADPLPHLALPLPSFAHLRRMTDHLGLWEHARYTTPRPGHGYCSDDNARGLIVTCRQPVPSLDVRDMARIYLGFLESAALPHGGFHNRRRMDGSWADEIGSDDSQGRAIWGLGSAARLGPEEWMRRAALDLFEHQLGFTSTSPRANAFAVLGAAEVLSAIPEHGPSRDAMLRWVGHVEVRAEQSWPWPEVRLAYDNARLPEALMAAGAFLGHDHLVEAGLGLLEWLVNVETRDRHYSFTPVGGWARGEPRPGYDQQPVETAAMADACSRAWQLTADARWKDGVLRAAWWLIGGNDIDAVLYDLQTGGCCDGLTPTGPNLNQGAESTLAALSTLQQASTLS